jgi:hypothetical protein
VNLLDSFSKNIQISNFMIIRSMGAKLVHADKWMDERRAGMARLIVGFRNFGNAHKKSKAIFGVFKFAPVKLAPSLQKHNNELSKYVEIAN